MPELKGPYNVSSIIPRPTRDVDPEYWYPQHENSQARKPENTKKTPACQAPAETAAPADAVDPPSRAAVPLDGLFAVSVLSSGLWGLQCRIWNVEFSFKVPGVGLYGGGFMDLHHLE